MIKASLFAFKILQDWLDACIALGVVSAVLVVFHRHNPLANVKQGPILEEMSQILLTNTNQREPGLSTPLALTLLSQRKLALTARNTLLAL